ncbi:FAD-dependent oxidoreductase [Kineococcus sp. SYSU DK005]|uniref:FAD-dependent oxidoreductase n=1 Tax=Kineococcus sp. SYSU DK005 TaxID=3383126 RepID=UPI003D7CC4FA
MAPGAGRVHDVLVVGAGSAGLFLAAALAQRGVDVVVLERRTAAGTGSRAIGLHPPAVLALRALGLEQEALALGARVERGVARSRGRRLGALGFERAWPERPFVLTLPQHRTEALLARRLRQFAPAALRRGWEVLGTREDGGVVHVTARGAGGPVRTWRARVLVGADGAHGGTRERAGIGAHGRTYPDTYLMGDFADTTGDAGTAVIHLEPAGVVESFPLPAGRRRWVVHTGAAPSAPGAPSTPAAPAAPGAPAGASAQALAALVAARTGEVLDPATASAVSAFAVHRRLARRMVAGRQVLIGDAAHEISPIGGQGMTLGWLDAQALVPLLVRVLAGGTGADLRSVRGFVRFERERTRAARTAARRAGLNTVLGRPAGAGLGRAREALVRALLGGPLRHPLAGAFTMRRSGGDRAPAPLLDTVLTASTER